MGREPAPLLVALSGGCDSVTLLFLLRFCAPDPGLRLTAAHLDHSMRPESAADAGWVAGLCAAWGVPLVRERLDRPPLNETEARRARHAFLRRTARSLGAGLIATGHHADDQAETVLFRALRGTGLAGLAGIRARGEGGLVRPLLPFWRREIERFARERGLRWRSDRSNLSLGPARNRLRHEILPLAERWVAPAARRNLVSLSALAREAEAALDALAEEAFRALVTEEERAFVVARSGLSGYDSAVVSRVLRALLRRFGVVPGRAGTRATLQFIREAPSGRTRELPGGVRVTIEFDRARVERPADAPAEPEGRPVEIGGPVPGGEELRAGGRRYRVEWGPESTGAELELALPLTAIHFPLRLGAWEPGDRIRTAGGTKSLKKLFVERRVPRARRHRLPVLRDATGTVLWVAGVARSSLPTLDAGGPCLFLSIRDARPRPDPRPDRRS